MKTTEAITYLKSENVLRGLLIQGESNSVRKAFRSVSFSFKSGGANKCFTISKKTYSELKQTALFN